ncbi:polysaccharide pyruvyl transferase family protein [Aerococcus urinaeequi]|uniref:Polysaccharide pyruvyl transferase family protein n=1 Tax=Aerococcus urinaeequi TaxID=51665 RepID=A0AA47J299_9LACT|nr:polysaccharide pyruvyl transferase family protein [Aerococcus urinaeequi]WAT23980.1 polysaccharide pyruvyl transferase family protein [Aerococcus urinaeequi]
MRDRIGIVTLHGYNNYGNKLQNYALKVTLEKLQFEVDTTVIEEKNVQRKREHDLIVKKMIRSPKEFPSIVSKLLKRKATSNQSKSKYAILREEMFKDFSNKYLNEIFFSLENGEDTSKIKGYSYFVTGSDQVWNPLYYGKLPIYFLTFTEKNKRIAYAPSISHDTLPNLYKKEYRKWLEEMASISIREDAGKEIIKELSGRDVPVLMDPTLLLKKEEWIGISKKSKYEPEEGYLLTYFLGDPEEKIANLIKNLAMERNLRIINLGDSNNQTFENGPSEFISYINNANAFFTDSFHGIVFSIILQTPFVAFKRKYSGPSMYSRIDTLLRKFDFKNREIENFDEDYFSMDFKNSTEILESEYQKSILYLKDALQIED